VDAVTGKITFKRLGTGKKKGSTTVKVGEDIIAAPKPKKVPRARPPPKPRMPRKKKVKVQKDPPPRKIFVGPETLEGFRDPMTGDKVDDLAISPFGHIMSYEVYLLLFFFFPLSVLLLLSLFYRLLVLTLFFSLFFSSSSSSSHLLIAVLDQSPAAFVRRH
jgi:hypothetical protein